MLEFADILHRHSEKIMLLMGGHIHLSDFRAPQIYPGVLDKRVLLLVTPSISPIFNNNPAYSILDIEK